MGAASCIEWHPMAQPPTKEKNYFFNGCGGSLHSFLLHKWIKKKILKRKDKMIKCERGILFIVNSQGIPLLIIE